MLLEINPENPEPRKIQRAVDALQAGEIIAYPTDTVYGIGCDLFNKKALDRLYQMKGLPAHVYFPSCAKIWRKSPAMPCCMMAYLGRSSVIFRDRFASFSIPPAKSRALFNRLEKRLVSACQITQ